MTKERWPFFKGTKFTCSDESKFIQEYSGTTYKRSTEGFQYFTSGGPPVLFLVFVVCCCWSGFVVFVLSLVFPLLAFDAQGRHSSKTVTIVMMSAAPEQKKKTSTKTEKKKKENVLLVLDVVCPMSKTHWLYWPHRLVLISLYCAMPSFRK